ncbi:hypothetical protein DH2020_022578 [Rehmannia glutinosa]|uniref:N-acetyl-D-glucosamine kinase n=1 Tax=Rehmannia glutinosa TaxID=99300 RepID=A0ABR0W7X5_REHGL
MAAAAAYSNGVRNDIEFLNRGVNGRKVVLGIDGGTTSTVCICMPLIPSAQPLPDHSARLARAVAGAQPQQRWRARHVSWLSDRAGFYIKSAARETLEQVMADALARSASTRSAVQAVCLSVSGVNHPTDQHQIFPSHVRLFVQNDAVAALASGTMGKLHGCVLIAGTGTIAYGFTEDGREARAAGAGPVLGDWEGRGFIIIVCALAVYMSSFAALSPCFFGYGIAAQALTSLDPVANNILYDAVHELASSVKAVVERLELCGEDGKGPFPLVMVGGVLEANKRWDIGNEVMSCISRISWCSSIRPKIFSSPSNSSYLAMPG